MKFERALEFTRYNSGKHMLDSGGESGRLWQRPPPPQSLTVGDSIGLTAVLAEYFNEDEELNAAYHEWVAVRRSGRGQRDGGWFETTAEFMEEMGYQEVARDNIYNTENDFDQVFVFEIWSLDRVKDWYYSKDVVVVLYIHTGADVRGGYSPPLFGKWTTESNLPELRLRWYAEPGDPDSADAAEEFNQSGQESTRYSIECDGYETEDLPDGGFIGKKDGVVLKFTPDYCP